MHEDFRVGVISNGRRAVQRTKLRAAGLLPLIDPSAIFISGELGVRKPAAAIFELAIRATGLEPAATLFVGDHEEDDIDGARAAGMRTCRVAPPGTATSAEHRVEHVSELVGVLACAT
jgi:putative hydrolase of the HAD superfamily